MKITYIDKLAFIDIKEKKVLSTRSIGNDTWYIPGGKREGNETDSEALIREIQEELTVHILPESIQHYGTFEAQAHGKPEGAMVRMICYTAQYTGTLQASSEVAEYRYVGYGWKQKSSPVDQLIFDDLFKKSMLI